MLDMKKSIKDTTPVAGSRACSTTVLAWQFGPNADPLVRCPLEQIDMWVQTWKATTREERHDTRYTWQTHLSSFLTSGKYLNSMGPAAGTINAILRTGWKPARPDLWQVEEGTHVVLDKEPFSRFQVIARAFHDLQGKVWAKAAEHEHGGGLETGIPSFEGARSAIKYLKRNGLFKEARALEYILVGFFKDPEPDDHSHTAFCPRCAKRKRATRFHTTYECPDNENIDLEMF